MNKLIDRLILLPNFGYIMLALIIILGFVVRLYALNSPVADWHSFRQADTASVTRFLYSGEANVFYPKYHDVSRVQSGMDNPNGFRFVEFPLYNLIVAYLAKAFGLISLEVVGRLVSILSALGSGYLIFLLGKKYISFFGGLLAAFFYLLIPFNIFFTRVILPEPFAVFLGLLALYLAVRFVENENAWTLFSSSVVFSLALLVKPYMIFYAIPALYIVYSKYTLKRLFTGKFILALIVSIMPLFLWRLHMLSYPEGIPFWKWTLNGDGIRFKPAFWYWIFGERLTKLILGFLGLIPFSFGVAAYSKKVSFIHIFAISMFLYLATIATANVRHDYYQILIIPSVSLMLSWGVFSMWKLPYFEKKAVRGLLVFSVVFMFMAGFMQVREFYRINHPEIIEAGKVVSELTKEEDLVIASYNGDTAFLYHTRRRGWPVVELPIDELIQKGAKYFVSVNLNDVQTLELEKRFAAVAKTSNFIILKLVK